jgi:hypothetical protein
MRASFAFGQPSISVLKNNPDNCGRNHNLSVDEHQVETKVKNSASYLLHFWVSLERNMNIKIHDHGRSK